MFKTKSNKKGRNHTATRDRPQQLVRVFGATKVQSYCPLYWGLHNSLWIMKGECRLLSRSVHWHISHLTLHSQATCSLTFVMQNIRAVVLIVVPQEGKIQTLLTQLICSAQSRTIINKHRRCSIVITNRTFSVNLSFPSFYLAGNKSSRI